MKANSRDCRSISSRRSRGRSAWVTDPSSPYWIVPGLVATRKSLFHSGGLRRLAVRLRTWENEGTGVRWLSDAR